ncbi:MAG: universal stress protein [Aeropyrum sp.]|nr:universal stress protein [Aeropyrum sp.]
MEKGVLKHLLLPLDLSDVAEPLVKVVGEIAKQYGSRVTLLHVIEESIVFHVAGGYDVTGLIKTLEERARRKLEEFNTQLSDMGVDAEVYHDIPVGSPGAVISKIAVEISASEIVMATKGIGISRILPVGSTFKETVKLAHSPVLRFKVYKDEGRVKLVSNIPLFKRLLLCVDRNVSKDMINYAFSAASRDDGKIILLHVIEPPQTEPEYEIRNAIKYGEKLSRDSGVDMEVIMARGSAEKLIREVSEQMDVSSLIMGRTVEKKISELILGSTLDRLIIVSPKPIVIYPL